MKPRQHRVLWGPRFVRGSNEGEMSCSCGEKLWYEAVKDENDRDSNTFAQHRKAAGARWASISSTIGARIPGDPELVWQERGMFPVVRKGVAA